MDGSGNFGGLENRTGDQRGQGGAMPNSYRLPNESLSRAQYANALDKHAAGDASRPGLLARIKRWLAAQL